MSSHSSIVANSMAVRQMHLRTNYKPGVAVTSVVPARVKVFGSADLELLCKNFMKFLRSG